MTGRNGHSTSLHPRPAALDHAHIALVLQGGGALGAYQAGVFEALAAIEAEPHWLAGVSIGAINSAIIAGNLPSKRVERLHEFWQTVSSGNGFLPPMLDAQWPAFHQVSASLAASFGVPGFYTPRVPGPFFQPEGTDAAISFYDTSALRQTLERLINFDLINSKRVRLSLGAVNVRTGNSEYFDNTEREIGPEHVMASGALPPAFAPVMIDGEPYWDGGIVSNSPLQYVLDNRPQEKMLAVQVDLFNARGSLPLTMSAALARHKDIQFSSRTRFNTDQAAQSIRQRRALTRLIARLPKELRDDPEIHALATSNRCAHLDIVHLIYRQDKYELESKDYEFSRVTMQAHLEAGRRDMEHTLSHPDWLKRSDPDEGVTIYDMGKR